MRSTLVLVLLLLAALPARAQRPGGDTGWAELLRPDHRRARRRIREGLRRLLRSRNLNHELGDAPRYLVLDGALRRFERARRVMGDDAELAYFVATALTEWERPDAYGGTEYRSVEAIHAWREVRRIDPDFMPQRVAYQLAMLHMRQHEFRRALAEYEKARTGPDAPDR